ncbi:hypothetical protein B9Z65_2318 [Elsinoe australis]|uniref:Uncharacterized protein n=1 Tax=Elsinoe australis TaxID=40998 RepID=A0A2P7ZAE0_9PEZI|nr:hypothetical protein B9Z65_2318 [Elsinoe australis]
MNTTSLVLVYYKNQYRIARYGVWDGYPESAGLNVLGFLSKPMYVHRLVLNPPKLFTPTKVQSDNINNLAEDISRNAYDMITPTEDEQFAPRYGTWKWMQATFVIRGEDDPRGGDQAAGGVAHAKQEDKTLSTDQWVKVAIDPTKEIPSTEDVCVTWETLKQDAYFPLLRNCPSLAPETGAGILSLVANATGMIPVRRETSHIASADWVYVVDVDKVVLEVFSGIHGVRGGKRFGKIEYGPGFVAGWRLDDLPSPKDFLKGIDAAIMSR